MKVNELRIGNLVKTTDTLDEIEVFHLDTDSDRSRINYMGSDNFEPIILTEEYSKRLGFTKDGLGLSIDISVFKNTYKKLILSGDYLYLREGDVSDHRGRDHLVVLWNKDLKKQFCVHELQNIYFSITGKELIFI